VYETKMNLILDWGPIPKMTTYGYASISKSKKSETSVVGFIYLLSSFSCFSLLELESI
jgi:hypothetical protein